MSATVKRGLKACSILGTSVGLLALSAGGAAAQTEPSDSEEIVVTAQHREQQITDIPLAVNAFSGAELEDRDVTSLQDLTKIDPTFAAQNYGAAFNQYIIRGVSSEIGATVGMYLDEAPVIGGTLTESGGDGKPGLRLHDVARVEILRGPQGTLFGSSSMSGTLRVIANRPDYQSFEGSWSASTEAVDGGNALTMADVALNIPIITDRVAIRAVAWGESGGGYIDQVRPEFSFYDVNDVSTEGARISIGAALTERFHLYGMYLHQEIEVDGAQNWFLPVAGPPGSEWDSPPSGPYFNKAQSQEPYADEYDLAYLEATYDLSMGTLLAAFSSTTQWVSRPEDTSPTLQFFTGAPLTGDFIITQDFEATTGEVRFSSDFDGPFQLVTGAFYQDSTVTSDAQVVLTGLIEGQGEIPCFTYGACTAGGFTPFIVFSTLDNIDVEQYAFYAQGDYDLSEQLTLTLGLRYYAADIRDYGMIQQDVIITDEDACQDLYGHGAPCGFAVGDVTVPRDRGTIESSENQMTYNASLLYEATDDVTLYARAASGFRIGGVNNSALLAEQGGADVPRTFDPDSLWSYEIGAKAYFWDRRGYLDLAAYRIDWTDQQLNATDSSGAFDYQLNAGKTVINGVELQASVMLLEGLTVGGGIVYTDATLAEDLPAGSQIGLDGDQLPGVSEWAGSLNAEYEWVLGGNVNGFAQLTGSYRSEAGTAFNPADPLYVQREEYTLWDAAVGIRQDELEARIFVRNIANEPAQYAINVGIDGFRVYSARPLTVGVRLSGHF